MILDLIENAGRYESLHPLFGKVFAALRKRSLGSWIDGREELAGVQLYASVATNSPKKRSAARLEAHRKYIDVQVVLEGEEEIGWRSRCHCRAKDGEYDPEKDLEFFKERPQSWSRLTAGSFAVFFPEDAHAPGVSSQEVKKIVFKAAVG